MVQNNTLVGIVPPYLIIPQVLASLGDEINKRESTNNPKACNNQNGCIAGMGLWGFISSTWNGTIDKMLEAKVSLSERCQEKVNWREQDAILENQRTHPIFDEKGGCSDIIGMWLLENEGIKHWEGDGTWGSGPYDLMLYK